MNYGMFFRVTIVVLMLSAGGFMVVQSGVFSLESIKNEKITTLAKPIEKVTQTVVVPEKRFISKPMVVNVSKREFLQQSKSKTTQPKSPSPDSFKKVNNIILDKDSIEVLAIMTSLQNLEETVAAILKLKTDEEKKRLKEILSNFKKESAELQKYFWKTKKIEKTGNEIETKIFEPYEPYYDKGGSQLEDALINEFVSLSSSDDPQKSAKKAVAVIADDYFDNFGKLKSNLSKMTLETVK